MGKKKKKSPGGLSVSTEAQAPTCWACHGVLRECQRTYPAENVIGSQDPPGRRNLLGPAMACYGNTHKGIKRTQQSNVVWSQDPPRRRHLRPPLFPLVHPFVAQRQLLNLLPELLALLGQLDTSGRGRQAQGCHACEQWPGLCCCSLRCSLLLFSVGVLCCCSLLVFSVPIPCCSSEDHAAEEVEGLQLQWAHTYRLSWLDSGQPIVNSEDLVDAPQDSQSDVEPSRATSLRLGLGILPECSLVLEQQIASAGPARTRGHWVADAPADAPGMYSRSSSAQFSSVKLSSAQLSSARLSSAQLSSIPAELNFHRYEFLP